MKYERIDVVHPALSATVDRKSSLQLLNKSNWKFWVSIVIAAICAGGCGYAVYYAIQQYEFVIYKNEYDSTTVQIHNSLDGGLTNNYLVTEALAEACGFHCPYKSNWPNCSIPFNAFSLVLISLLKIGLLRDMGTVPLLYPPKDTASFEAFAYEFFAETSYYPSNIGVSPFGRGIYGKFLNGTKYHDRTGKTKFSKRNILTPVFEIYDYESLTAVMYNLHSEKYRAIAIDSVMDAWDSGIRNKSAVTPLVQLVQDPSPRPASLMVFPIAPPNDPDVLVGFIRIVHNWDTILSQAVPSNAKGIDFVVSDNIKMVTFTITDDRTVGFKGSGDVHDRQFNSYRRQYNAFTNDGYSAYSVVFYPNASYFPSFLMIGPIVGCVVTIVFILLCTLCFAAYNFYMNRQLLHKQEALDSKRSFVRFISHEIRTPMNTVCMGLRVLQDEAQSALSTFMVRLDNAFKASASATSSVSKLMERVSRWIDLMQEVEESSNNAVSVLNELLNYDKIEMKTLKIDKELLPVWSLISSSVKPFHIQAKEKGLVMNMLLERDPLAEGLLVIGDSLRLAQVFRNVVSNALKFSFKGTSVEIKQVWHKDRLLEAGKLAIEDISDTNLEPAGSVEISVKDSGAGLSADNLKQLFREGMQFNANKLQGGGGSGLGLWIAKGIVNLHGGIISATSEGQGTGATFTVELPVVRALSADARSKQNSHSQNNDHGSLLLGGDSLSLQDPFDRIVVRNVLVVDDAPLNRKMLCRLLTNIGCKCMEFCNGYECVEMMRNKLQRSQSASNSKKLTLMNVDNEFSEMDEQIHSKGSNHNNIEDFYDDDTAIDLILMDFEMPVKKGPEACAELRAMGVDCLIVGVTGNVLQADIDYYVSMGAQSVVAKPFSLVKLMETLKRFHCVSLGKKIL